MNCSLYLPTQGTYLLHLDHLVTFIPIAVFSILVNGMQRSYVGIRRVMKAQGKSVVQMPNKGGIRFTPGTARRMFSEGGEFDVRYYSIAELLRLFEER